MGLHALGDTAWLFKVGGNDLEKKLELVLRLRRLIGLNRIPEIIDVVSSYDTIAVIFNPSDGELVFDHLTSLHLEEVDDHQALESFTITIPVVYGGEYGPDLIHIAEACQLTPNEFIECHRSAEYTVAALGFSPGFPYLSGLPKPLHQPRKSSPRRVAAGSVGIAGNQTGIYPFASQGGWHIIGRTDLKLFDVGRDDINLLHPGDKVRFVELERLQEKDEPESAIPQAAEGIRIIEPGALSSVQDHGRWGKQHLGVTHGGAADPVQASIANRLVGNPDAAAVIECTMTGPLLQFECEATLAWVGWAHENSGRRHLVKPGSRIDLRGRMCHLRGYIAVAGGIEVPKVLGSSATDIRAGLGGHQGRALKHGDILNIGQIETREVPTSSRVGWPHPEGNLIELRYLRGMQSDWFSHEAKKLFSDRFFEISPASDRMGTLLKGPKLRLSEPREMLSQPVVAGSIQVKPEGSPIVLMTEHQTIGGYPQIGHVISADIPKLARAWPGTRVHFREVSLKQARAAWAKLKRDLGILSVGLSNTIRSTS